MQSILSHQTDQYTNAKPTNSNPAPSQPGAANPPGPAQLMRAPKTVNGSFLTSPVMKNIAGVMIATGTGLVLGCPWLAGLLIGIGVGTSWIGGLGIGIAAVGIGLWILCTYKTIDESPAEQNMAGQIAESALMGVAGIPYVILDVIGNACQSCICGDHLADEIVMPNPLLRSNPS